MSLDPERYTAGMFSFRVFHPPVREQVRTAILFAHGTGVPADTYQSLLQGIAAQSGAVVASYDMRGFGYASSSYSIEPQTGLWLRATEEHVQAAHCFDAYCLEAYPGRRLELVLLGHSLGGWLSIKATALLPVSQAIALDPVMLPSPKAWGWAFSCLVGLRWLHPIARTVLRRNPMPPTREETLAVMKRKRFFAGWVERDIEAYLDAIYEWTPSGVKPRQDKRYEALFFQMQPPSSWWQFYLIPRETRRRVRYSFIVGSASDVSNPRARWLMALIFKRLGFTVVEGGHMFPMQQIDATVAVVCGYLKGDDNCVKPGGQVYPKP